jgi:short-subunit dehydrogenase
MNHVLNGKSALVTGASSGLGVDFARQLAAMGAHLILVARREEQLNAVKAEIEAQHPVRVTVVAMDLSTPDAPQRLYDQLTAAGLEVDVLINNAGFGLHGPFLEIPWEREQNMLELDIVTLVHMTKLFTRAMAARGQGWVCQVASIGAYQPTPTYASYAAAKAFVLSFGEALNHELKPAGVKVSVVSPGVTATEFLAVSGQQATLYQRLVMMQSPEVVRIAIAAMLKGTPSVVPGLINAVSAWSNRLIPRRVSTMIAERLMT